MGQAIIKHFVSEDQKVEVMTVKICGEYITTSRVERYGSVGLITEKTDILQLAMIQFNLAVNKAMSKSNAFLHDNGDFGPMLHGVVE